MRILLTGAKGQLGCELQRVLIGEELVLVDLPDYDVTDPAVGQRIARHRPDCVIHAAAYTDVDGCEQNKELAFEVNAAGTRRVAEAAANAGARLVYLSTDYVFDGKKAEPYTETDDVNPINIYGLSKLKGEEEAVKACSRTTIIRTSWLYGRQGKNFVKTMLRLAAVQSEIRVVDDQRGSPTLASNLAKVIAGLIHEDPPVVLHAGGQGECSWFEFARTIIADAGLQCRLIPISSQESGRLANRPSYSVLSINTLRGLGFNLPPWREALQEFLTQQASPTAGAEAANT